MSLYLYDAAFSPRLDLPIAGGAIGMSHYLTRTYATTSPQPAAVRAKGMGVLNNWEGWANEMVGASYTKGQAIAKEAIAALRPGLPRDNTRSIYFSIDVDLSDLSACDRCLTGINSVMRPAGLLVGVYAEGEAIERYAKAGLTQVKGWLSMSEGFTPGIPGKTSHERYAEFIKGGHVGLVQMHDAQGNWIGTDVPGTDRNTIIDPYSLGLDWPDNSPYLKKGFTTMALDPEVKARFDALDKAMTGLPGRVWSFEITHAADGTKASANAWLRFANRFAKVAANQQQIDASQLASDIATHLGLTSETVEAALIHALEGATIQVQKGTVQ